MALVWLVLALAAVGFLVATPPSAGPDEPTHQATAWFVTEFGLPPRVGYAPNAPTSISASVPASLVINPCFAHHPQVSADCLPTGPADAGMAETSAITNYPPPYYWVVGAGQRIAAVAGLEYAGVGGRLAAMVLNLGVLLLLAAYLARRHRAWPGVLLLVATSTAVFSWVVVNPSGWEMTAALAMAVLLAEAAWRPEGDAGGAAGTGTSVLLVLASIALCLARPIGFVWAVGLAVTVIAMTPSPQRRRSAVRVATAVAPGVVLGVLWLLTHPTAVGHPTPGSPTSPLTPAHFVEWFVASLATSLTQFREMFGVLGWNDTMMPMPLLLANLAAWAVLLIRMRPGRAAAVCAIGMIVIVPSALAAIGWGAWPLWWQGRYTLPVAMAIMVLLLLRAGARAPLTAAAVTGIALVSLGFMVWLNAFRYAFGLSPDSLPPHTASAIGSIPLAFALVAGALVVLAGVAALLRTLDQARRSARPGSGRDASLGRNPSS